MSTGDGSAVSVREIRVLRTVILLRHGQQDESTPDGSGGLTEIGLRQAALAAERLSVEPIDRIVSSGLRRASQTAQAVARHHASVKVETFLGVQVTGLNDTGHMPPELLAYG